MLRKWLWALLLTRAATAAPEVVAHWPLDHLVNGQVTDDGPLGLTATLSGEPAPTSVAGQRGDALEFAPGEAALVVPRHPALAWSGPFTIALWMRPDKTNQAMELLCHSGDTSPDGWRLRAGWGQVIFTFPTPEGPVTVSVPTRTLPTGRWVHVAVTADGETLRLYLNAEEAASRPCSVWPQPGRSDLVIGNYTGRKNAYPFVGALDDIWLLSGSLDAEAIYRLAAQGELE